MDIMWRFYKLKLFTDFVVELDDGKEYHVHRVVLAGKSPFMVKLLVENPELKKCKQLYLTISLSVQ